MSCSSSSPPTGRQGNVDLKYSLSWSLMIACSDLAVLPRKAERGDTFFSYPCLACRIAVQSLGQCIFLDNLGDVQPHLLKETKNSSWVPQVRLKGKKKKIVKRKCDGILSGETMSAEVCWPPPVWAMGFKGTPQLCEGTSLLLQTEALWTSFCSCKTPCISELGGKGHMLDLVMWT